MAFELQIMIGGLCLFVPDPDDDRMDVLMPETGRHPCGDGADPHEHILALRYDEGGEEREVLMKGGVLDLSGLSTSAPIFLSLPEVVDLHRVTRKKINRDQPAGPGQVRARLTVDAGFASGHLPGARWELAPFGVQQMATAVTWTIPNIELDELNLGKFGLAPCAGHELPVLRPKNKVIKCRLFHIPLSEKDREYPSTEELKPGDPALHFQRFYTLFKDPNPGPVPKFAGLCSTRRGEVRHSEGTAVSLSPEQLRGLQYTCMVASATSD